MPRVSQFQMDDKRARELIGQLWDAFTMLENRTEVRKFFSKFFTPTEIMMLGKRLELLKYADSDLEVSQLQKLTRVSKVTIYEWLEKHDSFEKDLHIVLDRLKELDQKHMDRIEKSVDQRGLPRHPRSKVDVIADLTRVGTVLQQGYKKRQKRKSVLLNVE